ncbi:hypothetical protein EV360DRAFT_87785 [Lentinula raphanica]|nr:hypothetical protein EV360DRAFT_87785 [Lentinula raphanica]
MIPEVPLEDFFHFILPPLPRSQGNFIEKVINILEENGTIDKDNDRWSAFREDPCKHSENESQAFQGLTLIWKEVISAAKEAGASLEQTFGLVVGGHAHISSDQGHLCRPDAFNELYSKTQATTAQTHSNTSNAKQSKMPEDCHHVYDIANPYQFHKDDGVNQTIEDFSKVIDDMEQMLARDPCRRFTFGTTIENRTTRLWSLSRASLLRSTSFDFMTDRPRLVHLFLLLAFSSLQDLGWDTTMSLSHVDSSSRRQYNINVDAEQFTTMEILSDASADSPLGRATRVWKVKDSKGHIRVLKDVWLETDRKEEHVILEDILIAAESIKSEFEHDYRAELEKHMLKPMAHCRVLVDYKTVEGEPVKGQPDDTGAIMLRGYDLGSANIVKLLPNKASTPAPPPSTTHSTPDDRDYIPSSSSRLTDGLNTKSGHLEPSAVFFPQATLAQVDQTDAANVAQQKAARTYAGHHRYHYRIVFEQYATTIYDERNLGNVFRALVDVTIALWIIYLAGWVHRDISGGNVYWFAHANAGLLGDFEYAVKTSEKRHHDVRTGTPFFMAAETMCDKYIYTPRNLTEEDPPTTLTDALNPAGEDAAPVPMAGPKPPFSYNPLHDLESIWWIIVYVLFFNDDKSFRSPEPEIRQDQMEKLFHGRLDSYERQQFLEDVGEGDIANLKKWISPTLLPALNLLFPLASKLITAYTSSEKTYPKEIDDRRFNIHHIFTKYLRTAAKLSSTITMTPVKATAVKRPNPTLPVETDSGRPSKRSRTSVNAEPSGSGSRTGNSSSRRTR